MHYIYIYIYIYIYTVSDSDLCPSSGILKTIEHSVSGTESVSVFRWEGNTFCVGYLDRLCGLVVRVLGYRYRGPGSIPDTTRKEK
jgi:hypothetical protein